MAVSAEQMARELRSFDDRRVLVQAMRRALTRSAKPVTGKVRAYAEAILPKSGGLNLWVAKSRIGVRISYAARSAGIRMKGSRKSLRDKSDLQRIDAGVVRHPSWGERGRGAWHLQTVTPGWWSKPLADDEQFIGLVDAEVDQALQKIRG